jgi:hypothetical protein
MKGTENLHTFLKLRAPGIQETLIHMNKKNHGSQPIKAKRNKRRKILNLSDTPTNQSNSLTQHY